MAEMDCATCESLIDAYVDGELSADVAVALEHALPRCPHCRHRLDEARILRDALRNAPRAGAPASLRSAIIAALPVAGESAAIVPMPMPRPGIGLSRRQTMRWAAMVLFGMGVGWVAGRYVRLPLGPDDTPEIMAGYLRLTSSERPVEVASSDRHTVKPWFSGRIAYAPPVHDLTTDGFPLVGGRVDVIDGRKVAVLVYQRNRHLIGLFVWPDELRGTAAGETRDGFGLRRWWHGGFAFRAIADLPPSDLDRFAAALDARLDAER